MNDGTIQPMMMPGQGVQPGQTAQPAMAGEVPQNNMQGQPMPQMQPVMGPNGQPLIGANGMPVMQPAPVVQVDKSGGASGLIKTIVIIILSLLALTFIGLFIWKQMEFAEVQEDVQGQIDVAVQEAK